MKWIKKYFTPDCKKIQGKSRNKRALDCLRALSFGPVEIRKALIELNGVKVKNLARQDGVSAATLYNTLRGRRVSHKAVELIARSLDLSGDELFPVGAATVPPDPMPNLNPVGAATVPPDDKELC